MKNMRNFGGLLSYGIPDFRLPREVIEKTIQRVLNLGVEVVLNKKLGEDIFLEDLKEEYDAILLTFGANVSSKMNIEGEDLAGVYGGNELLEYENYPNFTDKTVLIIGGGNTAMDAARTIKRKGAKAVTIVYRRSEKEMPAEEEEIESAKREGISFLFQTNILKVLR